MKIATYIEVHNKLINDSPDNQSLNKHKCKASSKGFFQNGCCCS